MEKIDKKLTKDVANLANIPISDQEAENLANAFSETLEVIDQLQSLDVGETEPSHQVTGLTNIWREDKVIEEQMFTQEQALANAPRKHNGYFVVDRIISKQE
ncbi:MAG: Asp-tRNA(Asn)/Glu-tRNA(Gln) amidotransferase subunit GatC [Patescibacteria group bacterium]|nr:Asp-tRNA(Asn)/Glu-tRNA(Gln) amidotransferase subunit GatC [Patescibacteria group bacterium]